MDYDLHWQDRYKEMISTPKKALKRVHSGQRVFIGTGCGEPRELVKALTARAEELTGVEIVQLFMQDDTFYTNKKNKDSFTINSLFTGENAPFPPPESLGCQAPFLLSKIPHLFHSGQLSLDVVIIQVSPPDVNGKVSLGISVDIVHSAVENGSLIIAQINPQMPWALGDSLVDVYDLDILVPIDVPLLEKEEEKLNETVKSIGRNIASLIPDNATLQFGLGRTAESDFLPCAAIPFLHKKKNLTIHSEMLTDSIIDLVESGAVNGPTKSLDSGKIVASFCMGTQKLYDYVHNNQLFSFKPTEYVHEGKVIGNQSQLVTISLGQEIDLTGQVCTDPTESRLYPGIGYIGGLLDCTYDSAHSRKGKNIIALPAVGSRGSRIVSTLHHGAGVTITRDAIHYVVTEYGVAYLYGKAIQDRVMALISIAHPNFREQLLKEAIEAQYIKPVLAKGKTELFIPSDDFLRDSILQKDGSQVNFRSLQPTDVPNMRDLIHELSKEIIDYRLLSQQNRLLYKQIQDFVYIDQRKDVTIVGTAPTTQNNDIICMGRYCLDEKTNRAEVAIIIHDDWRNKGLGTFLFNHLAKIAQGNGIAGFTAKVMRHNQNIHTIIYHSGYKLFHTLEEDVYYFTIDF